MGTESTMILSGTEVLIVTFLFLTVMAGILTTVDSHYVISQTKASTIKQSVGSLGQNENVELKLIIAAEEDEFIEELGEGEILIKAHTSQAQRTIIGREIQTELGEGRITIIS